MQEWIDEHPETDWKDFPTSDTSISFSTIVRLTQKMPISNRGMPS